MGTSERNKEKKRKRQLEREKKSKRQRNGERESKKKKERKGDKEKERNREKKREGEISGERQRDREFNKIYLFLGEKCSRLVSKEKYTVQHVEENKTKYHKLVS